MENHSELSLGTSNTFPTPLFSMTIGDRDNTSKSLLPDVRWSLITENPESSCLHFTCLFLGTLGHKFSRYGSRPHATVTRIKGEVFRIGRSLFRCRIVFGWKEILQYLHRSLDSKKTLVWRGCHGGGRNK